MKVGDIVKGLHGEKRLGIIISIEKTIEEHRFHDGVRYKILWSNSTLGTHETYELDRVDNESR